MRATLLMFGPIFSISAGITALALAAPSAAPRQAPQQAATKSGGEPRPVKTVSYSGTEIEETSQTLGDGNHMTRVVKAKVYRDSEGRTRKEIIQDDADPERVGHITIYDPDSGVTYNLNPKDHTARKQVVVKSKQQYIEVKPQLSRRPPPALEARKPVVTTETLGERTIEGYRAVGSRTTVTHPAGAFGFGRPIVEVWETWNSPQLLTSVLNIRDDPRTGKDVVRLTDISMDDPPASLFQVPPDYILTEETITRTYPGPPPVLGDR